MGHGICLTVLGFGRRADLLGGLMAELDLRESNRSLWQIKAIGAHARCDWDAERHALDALHLLDRIRDINKWWAKECPTCEAAIGRGCKGMDDSEVHFTRALVHDAG